MLHLSLGKEGPDFGQVMMPEMSRREGFWPSLWGGIKDITRLPGRATRPLYESALGIRAPGLSYADEFARPDKYKTTTQEVWDEVMGLEGFGGAITKKAGLTAVNKLPNLASKLNKAIPFTAPAQTTLARLGANVPDATSSLTSRMFYDAARNTPNMVADIGYESTRSKDEDNIGYEMATGANLMGTALSSLLGHGAASGARKMFKESAPDNVISMSNFYKNDIIGYPRDKFSYQDYVTDVTKRNNQPADNLFSKTKDLFNTSELRKEIQQGSPVKLKEDLSLAKLVMPEADLTSRGARKELSDIYEGLNKARFNPSIRRRMDVREMDDALAGFKTTMDDGEFKYNELTDIDKKKFNPTGFNESVADRMITSMSENVDPYKQGEIHNIIKKTTTLDQLPKLSGVGSDYYNRAFNAVVNQLNNIDGSDNLIKSFINEMDNANTTFGKQKVLSKYRQYVKTPVENLLAPGAGTMKKTNPDRAILEIDYYDSVDPAKHQINSGQVEKLVKDRERLRNIAEDETDASRSQKYMKLAHKVKKKAMNDLLSESVLGRRILNDYKNLKQTYAIEEALPDLSDGKAVDTFMEKIARSRMNISSKANQFDDMIDIQNQINNILGTDYDYITNAILRRVQNKSFWNDALADNPSMARVLWEEAKTLTGRSLAQGKLSRLITSMLKSNERTETPEKKRMSIATLGRDDVSDKNGYNDKWLQEIEDAYKRDPSQAWQQNK